ncbi:MAG TPA: methyltransferase domain-containing protein [bacterium]|jgi:trans-aconitate methyltransferase|nr:methyltransferase domain-containing protein [bacterium]
MAQQTWNSQDYDQNARFVTNLGAGVMDLLAPQSGERILDLGCGDGIQAKQLMDLGCSVIGIDSSDSFIQSAKELGVDARLMDGQALTFKEEFDAVFSNAALHWMKQKEKVIEGVYRALKPGGRFVAEMGGKGNVNQLETAMRAALQKRGLLGKVPDPNFYPSPEEYQALLEQRGFKVEFIQHFDRATPLPHDAKAWVKTFRKSYLAELSPDDVPIFLEEVQEAVRPKLCDTQGRWTADYVRLRFKAVKN